MMGRVSDIDLRLLRIFHTVVEAGGFAVATAKLNVAESTISQHMSDLEKRIGLRLCERGRSGFRLTPSGEQVYRATIELLGSLDLFRDQLAELSSNISGRFAVGLPDAVVTLDHPAIVDGLDRFMQRTPELHLHIEMLTPRDLERKVIDGTLHVAIAPEHRRIAGLDYTPIFDEVNLLYCGDRHPLFSVPDDEITIEMLEQAGRISRGYLERFDAPFFSSEAYASTVQQTEAAALLILTGRRVGFLPAHYAAAWVEQGRMRALLAERIRFVSAFTIINRREAQGDARLDLFCSFFTGVGAAPEE